MSERPSRNIDSFSVFLKTVKGNNERVVQQQSLPEPAAAPPEGAPPVWRRMVTVLATRGSVPVPDLMKASGLGFSEFSEALQSATRNEMVRIVARDDGEVAELTEFGEKVATL
jgi:hypothetical protein